MAWDLVGVVCGSPHLSHIHNVFQDFKKSGFRVLDLKFILKGNEIGGLILDITVMGGQFMREVHAIFLGHL